MGPGTTISMLGRALAAILWLGTAGASTALAQQPAKGEPATKQAAAAKAGDATPVIAATQKPVEPAPKDAAGGTPTPAEGASAPTSRTEKPNPWLMLLAFVALPVLLLMVLHLVDSVQAYGFSRSTRDKALGALEGKLSAAQVLELAKMSPSGMAGTTRSIFTYGLLCVLGGAVFQLLLFSDAPKAPEYADKLLTVLAGALSSVIGFYFGSKATSEGVSSGAATRTDPPQQPAAAITRISPGRAAVGSEVRIEGRGFGDAPGNVDFAGVAAPKTLEWTATLIRVEVPAQAHKGQAVVSVNPSDGSRIVGNGIAFEIV
jgi:hypothetical protein